MATSDELHTALQIRCQQLAHHQSPVQGDEAVSFVPPPPLPHLDAEVPATSRWTPERLRKAIETLPAAVEFPELARRAGDILERWHRRFPLNVWSRFVKFADSGTGRKLQMPKVLKEFNESAPVLARLIDWVEASRKAGEPPVAIIDLCSGFGFLAMFASELLPAEHVERIYLVDNIWPNRNVPGSVGGGITTAHIYDHGEWKIPLLTLQINAKSGRELRGLAHHVIRDPRPTFICGIHLCGTLALRAIQMFNDGVNSGCGVSGLILSPCCLPRRQHRERQFVYSVGGHKFSCEELHDKKANPGLTAYEVYQEHLMACIGTSQKKRETMASLGKEDKDAAYQDKNVFFIAEAPYQHAGESAGVGTDFGAPVVVEGNHLGY